MGMKWLDDRNAAKSGGDTDKKSRRASSLPPSSSNTAADENDRNVLAGVWAGPLGVGLQVPEFTISEEDRRAWAEIVEEEQIKEAEEGRKADEELFSQLQQEEQRRLAQAEMTD